MEYTYYKDADNVPIVLVDVTEITEEEYNQLYTDLAAEVEAECVEYKTKSAKYVASTEKLNSANKFKYKKDKKEKEKKVK